MLFVVDPTWVVGSWFNTVTVESLIRWRWISLQNSWCSLAARLLQNQTDSINKLFNFLQHIVYTKTNLYNLSKAHLSMPSTMKRSVVDVDEITDGNWCSSRRCCCRFLMTEGCMVIFQHNNYYILIIHPHYLFNRLYSSIKAL